MGLDLCRSFLAKSTPKDDRLPGSFSICKESLRRTPTQARRAASCVWYRHCPPRWSRCCVSYFIQGLVSTNIHRNYVVAFWYNKHASLTLPLTLIFERSRSWNGIRMPLSSWACHGHAGLSFFSSRKTHNASPALCLVLF